MTKAELTALRDEKIDTYRKHVYPCSDHGIDFAQGFDACMEILWPLVLGHGKQLSELYRLCEEVIMISGVYEDSLITAQKGRHIDALTEISYIEAIGRNTVLKRRLDQLDKKIKALATHGIDTEKGD